MKLLTLKLFVFAVILFAAGSAFATYSYEVTVNTSSLSGRAYLTSSTITTVVRLPPLPFQTFLRAAHSHLLMMPPTRRTPQPFQVCCRARLSSRIRIQ